MMFALTMALGVAAPSAPQAAIASAVRSEVSAAATACRGNAVDVADANADIVVCAPGPSRYRIDRDVLEASRAREAPPPKPDLSADAAMPASTGCVGPNACQGSVVPLVRVALVAAQAAALALSGEDWREALRTKEDEYRLYQERQERRASERRVKVDFGPVRRRR